MLNGSGAKYHWAQKARRMWIKLLSEDYYLLATPKQNKKQRKIQQHDTEKGAGFLTSVPMDLEPLCRKKWYSSKVWIWWKSDKPYCWIKKCLKEGYSMLTEKNYYGITIRLGPISLLSWGCLVTSYLRRTETLWAFFYRGTVLFTAPVAGWGLEWAIFCYPIQLYHKKPVIIMSANYPNQNRRRNQHCTYDWGRGRCFHEFDHGPTRLVLRSILYHPIRILLWQPRLFVEFPVPILNWKLALYPEILRTTALHYQNGEQNSTKNLLR